MLDRLLLVTLLFGSLVACTPGETGSSNAISSPASPQAAPATPVSQPTASSTKTTTIRVEGETQQIPIELLQTPYFSTYFPSDRFITDSASSGEGSATWFYWKQPDGTTNKNVYVQVFFPGQRLSVDQVRQFLVGNRALFKANGWRRIDRGSGDRYAETAYSAWLRDLILFEPRTNPQNIRGTAYIGEIDGRAFYVISHYPGDYGDGFTPRADVILKNLKGRETGLSSNSKLALKGIGAIQVGMTVAQASKAIGQPLVSQGEPAPGSNCSYVAPQRSIQGLNFMVIGDRIARIDVRRSSPITTLSGAKIGDSEARIKQLYPGQITVTPHKYRPNGHYLTFTPKDAADRNYRLIFETDGKQVTDFRSGRLPEVTWVEGCS
ncbi:hypothetical protein ACQ4M3_05865 [Leptolyngbya sp. AN03gr2]|uniref:hypothetical protein n=1 Tax=unclassified Leptolyngbya TaxID=2650499 RepID=UPI003D3129CE